MPVVAAVIGAVVGGVASAAGAAAAVIAGTIAAAAAGAVTFVSAAVSSITAALSTTVGQVTAAVGTTVQSITAALKTGIGNLATAITKPLEPILLPIKNSLQTIHDYVKGVESFVNEQLKPFIELKELYDTITGLAVIRDLTSGIDAVGKLLGDVADGKSESTAAAIAQLIQGITKTTVGILDKTNQQYVELSDRIRNFDKIIRENYDKRMVELESKVYATIAGVEDSLTGRSVTVQRQVTAIARRTEDVPWFASMLVRVLS